jgi:hypothetical protein
MQKAILLLVSFLVAITVNCQLPFQEFEYAKIDSMPGTALYGKEVKKGNQRYVVYCQVIDLKKNTLSQFIEIDRSAKPGPGKYIGVKGLSDSPFFSTFFVDEATKKAKSKDKQNFIGMVNGGFFESFDPITQMAFPIKKDGAILTAGSSPSGPCENPRLPIFKEMQLKALVWTDSSVAIQNYDPKTGIPLTQEQYSNGLVTYAYDEHPANIFRPNVPDRFMLIGTARTPGNAADNLVVIMTFNKGNIEFAAAHLKELGIKSDIIALGGSASAFLYHRKKGMLEGPGVSLGNSGVSQIKLPHFLFFSKKDQ